MNKTLALLSVAALAAATGAAQAANCPRGQIYRVSKHACIDRDEAAKLGLVRGTAKDAKPRPAPQAETAPQEEPPAEPGADAAPQAEPAPEVKPVAPTKHVHTLRVAPVKPAPAAQDESPAARASSAPESPAPPAQDAMADRPATSPNQPSPFGVLDPGNVPMSQAR
jgi:hypothetical protein